MTKRSLAVGDRVRVYESTGIFEGTVKELLRGVGPDVRVEYGGDVVSMTRDVFDEQCRLLKKKVRKAERVDLRMMAWLLIVENYPGAIWFYTEESAKEMASELTAKSKISEFCEIHPGEAIVNRDVLAEAWTKAVSMFDPSCDVYFDDLSAALGLGGKATSKPALAAEMHPRGQTS